MAMPRTLTKAGRKPNDEPLADQGCTFAPSCLRCPFVACLLELPAAERVAIAAALRLVARYGQQPDQVISG
jgi:hypothetical protein